MSVKNTHSLTLTFSGRPDASRFSFNFLRHISNDCSTVPGTVVSRDSAPKNDII